MGQSSADMFFVLLEYLTTDHLPAVETCYQKSRYVVDKDDFIIK